MYIYIYIYIYIHTYTHTQGGTGAGAARGVQAEVEPGVEASARGFSWVPFGGRPFKLERCRDD